MLLLHFVREIWLPSGRCQGNVTEFWRSLLLWTLPYNGVIISVMASQITSLIVYSTVYSGTDQRKHQSSASLAFVRGIHRWPVNSLHKGPVTRKMFRFDGVMMETLCITLFYKLIQHSWCFNFVISHLVPWNSQLSLLSTCAIRLVGALGVQSVSISCHLSGW